MVSLSKILTVCAAAAVTTLVSANASAHINMKGLLKSRGGDQKSSPCDGAKGDGPVYEFEPGATITLGVDENVPHPSYFRIAFDDDGDDDFVEPASIKPIEASRACPYDKDDQCGEADFCNFTSDSGAQVLWDNLNPHTFFEAKSLTWNVKLPDLECENCTIQVIQVMQDTVHGAYCPQGSCQNAANSLEDIYHRCVDIKLKRGVKNSPGTTTEPVRNQGEQCPKAGGGGSTPSDDGNGTDEPNETTQDASAGGGTGKDAGVDNGDDGHDDADDHEAHDEADTATGTKKDAGKTSTGTKKDAGSKASNDDAPASSGDEGGCSLAQGQQSAQGGAWLLLAVGACFVRGRKKRAV